MNNFLSKKDIFITNDRIKITYYKIRLIKRNTENFLFFEDNLDSYVRTMYLLGEPCWGRYSTLNNKY